MENKHKLTRCIVQPSNLGSSETTREAPLDQTLTFDEYFEHYQPKSLKTRDSLFLEWFIGFSEGDGSFITSTNRCYFIINQKDIKVLYKIRKKLGFGQVFSYTQKNQSYGRYVVQDFKNCRRLASIFNGKLVLTKTNDRFQLWSQVLNFNALKSKGQVHLTNAWLAGFIEAEGCFYARVRKHSRMKTGYQVVRKFIIGQQNEPSLLLTLQALLKSKTKIQIIQKEDNNFYYRLEICSLESNDILLNYLRKFPCLGQKKINTLVYQRLSAYIVRKEHLDLNKLEKIKKLCLQLRKISILFDNENL